MPQVISGNLELSSPYFIGSRLLASIRIGCAVISLGYSARGGDGERVRYHYFIDFDNGETFEGDDLQSGAPIHDVPRGIAQGFGSLFSFLDAWHEALEYADRNATVFCDNRDMFPHGGLLEDWAREHSDDFTMARFEVDNTEDCEEYPEGYEFPIVEHDAP